MWRVLQDAWITQNSEYMYSKYMFIELSEMLTVSYTNLHNTASCHVQFWYRLASEMDTICGTLSSLHASSLRTTLGLVALMSLPSPTLCDLPSNVQLQNTKPWFAEFTCHKTQKPVKQTA